jgi:hypothetical protein
MPKRDPEHEAWLDQIVSLREGAALRGVSVDTLRELGKRGQLKVLQLSERRKGITRREAFKPIKK